MLAVVVVLALAMTLLPAGGAQAQRRNQVVVGLPSIVDNGTRMCSHCLKSSLRDVGVHLRL